MVATIKDIARIANVSHATVSRALRGSSLISPATTERIRKVASEMGYQPSAAARTLKTNRSRALGVIIRDVDDPFFSQILQGIESVAQTSGYSLFMAASQPERELDQNILQAMVERRVEGVIICSTPVSAEQGRQFTSFGVPIVMINNQSAEQYRYSIHHDDLDGSRQVTRHLLELGHRRLAYLGNANAGRSTLDRLAGFQEEIEQAGIPLPEAYIHQAHGSDPALGAEAAKYFLTLKQPPTALVCYNDMLAIGILHGLHAAGVNVPAEMSVTGFDNIVFSAYTNPPLTTFDQPKRFIGAEAARLVLGLLSGTQDASLQRIHTLKGSLLVRTSTAPPSEGS